MFIVGTEVDEPLKRVFVYSLKTPSSENNSDTRVLFFVEGTGRTLVTVKDEAPSVEQRTVSRQNGCVELSTLQRCRQFGVNRSLG